MIIIPMQSQVEITYASQRFAPLNGMVDKAMVRTSESVAATAVRTRT